MDMPTSIPTIHTKRKVTVEATESDHRNKKKKKTKQQEPRDKLIRIKWIHFLAGAYCDLSCSLLVVHCMSVLNCVVVLLISDYMQSVVAVVVLDYTYY